MSVFCVLYGSCVCKVAVARKSPMVDISKTVRLLWRCARHSDHITTITADIPSGDTEAHSATETPDRFADGWRVDLLSYCWTLPLVASPIL